MIEEGIYKIPLVLSESLEPQRKELEQVLVAAQRRLRKFAIRNGWSEFVKESFTERAEIYDSQNKFIKAVIRITGIDPSTQFPKEFSACLEQKIFMSVSPEVYSQIYPEGVEDRFFEKLVTHEMVHRLHIRILNGNEEAMGPIWFFEGFAIYAAGQLANYTIDPIEIWWILENSERTDYTKYGAIFRYFLKRFPIQKLIEHAGDKDFLRWLQQD